MPKARNCAALGEPGALILHIFRSALSVDSNFWVSRRPGARRPASGKYSRQKLTRSSPGSGPGAHSASSLSLSSFLVPFSLHLPVLRSSATSPSPFFLPGTPPPSCWLTRSPDPSPLAPSHVSPALSLLSASFFSEREQEGVQPWRHPSLQNRGPAEQKIWSPISSVCRFPAFSATSSRDKCLCFRPSHLLPSGLDKTNQFLHPALPVLPEPGQGAHCTVPPRLPGLRSTLKFTLKSVGSGG